MLSIFLFASCNEKDVDRQGEALFSENDHYNVAFLIMNGTYNTELTAPFDIFQHSIFRVGIKPMRVFLAANTFEPIKTFEGIRILPDYNYLEGKLHDTDILVVPSAENSMGKDIEDKRMLDFVKRSAEKAEFVTSHCDGAFVLAATGLLNGIESTTFPGDINKYKAAFPDLKVQEDVLFGHHGKFITSAGGAKSFEASLYLCELLYGENVAKRLAE